MRQLLASLAILMGLVGAAHAQVEGNPSAGREKAQVCAACHGQQGISSAPTFPNLAGQQASYLIKQITDIRDGERVVPQMAGIVADLSDQAIADLAAYYASLPPNLGQADPDLAQRGIILYKSGSLAKGIPACMACHMPTGKGIGTARYPALSGQHPEYTVTTLKAFARGERSNDPNAIMRDIAAKMSEDDMEAVANYVYGLH
ncbi:MAG: c-type cytochrome [Halomonas sp.]|nr:c-type cytochrome [Halomonas sp.]